MRRVWEYVSIKTISVLTPKEVMSIMSGALFVFHTLLLLFFAYFRIYPLVLVNAVSITLYAHCYNCVQNGGNFLRVFNLMYIEVIVHAVIATILLGTDSGFTLYLVTLVPIAYYAVYNFGLGEKAVSPMWYIFLAAGGFCLTRIVCSRMEPLYSYGNIKIDRRIYMMNYFITIVAIVAFFSTLLNQIRLLEEARERQNRKLERLSKIDPLTGLMNRRCIHEQYEKYKSLNEHYAVILGDIDDFKKVNDTYGHKTGDKVLREVAGVFRNMVRMEDVVCRWGGEEILVFLPGCTGEEAEVLAEQILAEIRKLKVTDEEKVSGNISMTMGIASDIEADEFQTVVQKADERLYHGKHSGKNRVVLKI